MATRHYCVSIGSDLARDVRRAAAIAGISCEEAVRRSILLLKHAVDADRVTLIHGGQEQNVIIR